MAETAICDGGCGQPLLVFDGFENVTTCGECFTRQQRLAIDSETKAAEWLEAMEWLDGEHVDGTGSLRQRLERFRQDLAEAYY